MSQYPSMPFKTRSGPTAPLELKVTGPDMTAGQRRVFEQPFVLVGRHERGGLCLDHAAVSRRHAYLQQLGGGIFFVDLGSRTGTFWGGEPRSSGWLLPGQGIEIGPF